MTNPADVPTFLEILDDFGLTGYLEASELDELIDQLKAREDIMIAEAVDYKLRKS
jgi:hypothetical protein